MTVIPASSGGPPSANTRRRMPSAMRRKQGQPLAAYCYAFGDHISDLPLLTVVGHPAR